MKYDAAREHARQTWREKEAGGAWCGAVRVQGGDLWHTSHGVTPDSQTQVHERAKVRDAQDELRCNSARVAESTAMMRVSNDALGTSKAVRVSEAQAISPAGHHPPGAVARARSRPQPDLT